tara:strand:- start:952 stop:1422 length:471 start_codon:yes stop_codon:yes gene_type:complete
MNTYKKQNCSLTLKEGLSEYYESSDPLIKEYADKYGSFLVNHDLTHVIFGLGTSLKEESMLDTWTLWATDITWKQIYEYAINKDLRDLTKELVSDIGGWFVVLKGVLKAIPLKLKIIFLRVPKVKKKWPYDSVTEQMLNEPIIKLREEYGIKILSK